MLAHRITVGLALAAGLVVLALGTARAADPPAAKGEKPKLKLNRDAAAKVAAKAEDKKNADDATADKQEKAEAKDDAEKKEEPKNPFAVPEGGVKELLAFIQETMNFRPKTREEYQALQTKGFPAMKEAAEKIKQIATDEDKTLPGFAEVDGLLLYFRANEAQRATSAERSKLVEDLTAYFASTPKPSRYGIGAASRLSSALEHARNVPEAVSLNRELGAQLAKSSDEETAQAGLKMEGTARRLELPGNTMEINGTEIDGSKFDWAKYRGKVVLVDFWATWCGPCIGELPNVKENYKLYHDKGFDVVGISLDSDRKRLEEFVVKEELPWATIYEGGGWNTPMAVYYGVNSIPRPILVDKEGKVVSMQARGPELTKLLAELLGPAEPAETKEKTADDDKPDAAKKE
ncbi:MAG: TlpA disulfide reductase family protein [Pirellulales bacterium]